MKKGAVTSFDDLLLLFFIGLALSYFHHFITPLNYTIQMLIAMVPVFIFAKTARHMSIIFEWALFFCLGLTMAPLVPLIYRNGFQMDLILILAKVMTPYCMAAMTGWIFAIPAGFVFSKRTFNRNYYRNPRFF